MLATQCSICEPVKMRACALTSAFFPARTPKNSLSESCTHIYFHQWPSCPRCGNSLHRLRGPNVRGIDIHADLRFRSCQFPYYRRSQEKFVLTHRTVESNLCESE